MVYLKESGSQEEWSKIGVKHSEDLQNKIVESYNTMAWVIN